MKNIIGLLLGLVVVAFSCNKSVDQRQVKRNYTVEITFNNGDKDTINIQGKQLNLDKGDLDVFVDDNAYFNYLTVASGVRSYKILK